ncbi:MAG TPA: aminotransferase class III-fold pyridoxal phosphate-dependent enzyme, partial [Gammaproteobacteria bacterium]|nr:aminotransferase class III-fold pyridoxal phosphate-dependent enzyme [Gammaproteobacteria bacterium]
GRPGELFACHHADVSPDIMCVGKALTGGYMTLAATLVTDEIATDICRSKAGALMHGPTFMANPLACSVALASIELLLSQDWQTRVQRMEQQMCNELAGCRTLPIVHDVRVIGSIGVVELNGMELPPGLQQKLVNEGVWLRPFRNLVYMIPPYVISEEQLSKLTAAVYRVLSQYS